jgi:hypothetical protein
MREQLSANSAVVRKNHRSPFDELRTNGFFLMTCASAMKKGSEI